MMVLIFCGTKDTENTSVVVIRMAERDFSCIEVSIITLQVQSSVKCKEKKEGNANNIIWDSADAATGLCYIDIMLLK